VGQDCVNGESFGFDTIRLKENNLRIRFVDTSSTSSFPSNDWQITANDSANGGANKFSIDDIDGGRTPFTIEAGAPSHSIYVDDGGRVGFGTSTPVVDLHVETGNTPTLRLEQDGSSGFSAQTWDVAGNEANFFIRDATNGSELPFRIIPGAPSNSLYIFSDGNVGLGTTSPDADLDIEGSEPSMLFGNTGTGGGKWMLSIDPTTGRFTVQDFNSEKKPIKMEPGADNNLLRIGMSGQNTADNNAVSIGKLNDAAELHVYGSIWLADTQQHPDYVFEPDYRLATIEEQAAFMWQNKHLPALPKAPEGLKGPVNVATHQFGILEELEKAHIYIEQLNHTIKALEVRLEKLEADGQ